MRMGIDNRFGWHGIAREGARWALAATVAIAASGAALGQAQLPCRYEVAHIITAPPCGMVGVPEGVDGFGISPNGRYVCGAYAQCADNLYAEGFIFDTVTGVFTTIPRPPGVVHLTGGDVNDSGMAIGQLERLGAGGPRGFVYSLQTGSLTELQPLPGGLWSAALAINNNNQVCGYRSIGPGVTPQTAFRWSAAEGYLDFGLVDGRDTMGRDINSDGLVAVSTGFSSTLGVTAQIWDGVSSIDIGVIPGGLSSGVAAINDAAQLATGGSVQQNPSITAGYLYDDGEFIARAPLPGGTPGFFGMNASGGIVGRCNFNQPFQHTRASVWHEVTARDLTDMLLDDGFTLRDAKDISDGGSIICTGSTPTASAGTVVLAPIYASVGDLNCDGIVGVGDLLALISQWGPCRHGCSSDLTNDGMTNVSDLLVLVAHWG